MVEEKSGNGCRNVAIGCGIVLLLCVIGAALAGYFLFSRGKQVIADGVRAGLADVIKQSPMTEADKQGMLVQVDRLADGFKAGDITLEQLAQVAENLSQSPVLPLATVMFVEAHSIKPSALTDEEKAAAQRSLERFARGVHEKKIDHGAIDDAISPISTRDAQGNIQLKEKPTVEELHEFLARVKKHADDAGIPDEPFKVDIVGEFKAAIDKALNQTTPAAGEGLPPIHEPTEIEPPAGVKEG